MPIARTHLRAALTVFALTTSAAAVANGKVDNFRLIDHTGKSHEFYYLSDMKAVVLFAQGNDCSLANSSLPALAGLSEKYRGAGVTVLGINSNLTDTRESVAKSMSKIALPVLMDSTQLVGESLELTKNGEVLVVDPKTWQVAYRGGVAYAADAVQSLVDGLPVKTAKAPVAGCDIAMPERDKRAAHAKISYAKTVAPILMDKCVACHREGGIGPWAMTSYELVRGFAPMIREVIRTQRMPPWHADPHYLPFSNDRGLTFEQAKTIVHWIEAGAPRGAGADPLLAQRKDWPEWTLGKPDLVVDIPEFKVPATGVVPYQHFTVENPLDRDVWIRAIDYVPGDRTVLHHTIASATSPGGRGFGGVSLHNYVPGAGPLVMPAGNGILLKKGGKFQFQMHYTTTGKEATDRTRFGLYFMDKQPEFNYRAMIMANPMLRIPPNAKEHVVTAQNTFKTDVVVYSVHPHSHFRGKSSNFVAYLPDGTQKMLLNVPNYDFNWQATYDLKEPLALPAGTRIVYTTVFDNSAQNKANPDPNIEVRWGEQTWQEMVFGVIRYRNVVENHNDTTPLIDFSAIQQQRE